MCFHDADANSCPQRAVDNRNMVGNGNIEACSQGCSWFTSFSLICVVSVAASAKMALLGTDFEWLGSGQIG